MVREIMDYIHLVMKQWEKLCMQSITGSSGIWN